MVDERTLEGLAAEHGTPLFVVDHDAIRKNLAEFRRLLPRVQAYFAASVKGPVERYELPGLGALNFVLHGCLDGGASRSRTIDPYGKALSSMLLDMEIDS